MACRSFVINKRVCIRSAFQRVVGRPSELPLRASCTRMAMDVRVSGGAIVNTVYEDTEPSALQYPPFCLMQPKRSPSLAESFLRELVFALRHADMNADMIPKLLVRAVYPSGKAFSTT